MTEDPGSDAQLTDEQRAELERQARAASAAVDAEEQRTAAAPATGRDGARYAH